MPDDASCFSPFTDPIYKRLRSLRERIDGALEKVDAATGQHIEADNKEALAFVQKAYAALCCCQGEALTVIMDLHARVVFAKEVGGER